MVPSAQGWVLSSWLSCGKDWGPAGLGKHSPQLCAQVSWPRLWPCWRGEWALAGAGSLPDRSPPSSVSTPTSRFRRGWVPQGPAFPVGSRLALPPPCPCPSPCSQHFCLWSLYWLEGGLWPPARPWTDFPALESLLFCINPAGWCLVRPIVFFFSSSSSLPFSFFFSLF